MPGPFISPLPLRPRATGYAQSLLDGERRIFHTLSMRVISVSTAGLALLLCLLLSACSVPPDEQELKQHLAATVQMGWNGLRIESVAILTCVEAGKDWKVDTSYGVRLTDDKDTLTQEEQERIARHLPMCDSILIHKDDHCTMRESVIFTQSAYGWMPRDLVASRPDLLPRVAEEGKRIAAGAAAR